MGAVLEIVKLGHPVLFQIAEPVADVRSARVQTLVDDMFETLEASGGVGLAAPQVGESLRIFIASSKPFPNYERAEAVPPTVMINPELVFTDSTLENNWEGCLSIPLLRGSVPRHPSLSVSYLNVHGERVKAHYGGLMARVIQHEQDHLDGKVFLDRIASSHDLMFEDEFQRQIVQPALENA